MFIWLIWLSHYRICDGKLHTTFLSLYCPFPPHHDLRPHQQFDHTVPKSVFKHSPRSSPMPLQRLFKIFQSSGFPVLCYNNKYVTTPHSAISYHSFFNPPLSYRLFYLPLPKSSFKTFVMGLLRLRTFKNSVLLIIEIYNVRFSHKIIER